MSYEDKPHYARLYRKGKKVGKIFEANPLYEFRNRAERIADQEEVRLLSGFGYWWHDKIRLRWAKALLFITCLSSGQWTAIGTVGLVVVGVLQYMNMTNSDGVNTDTPQKQEQIDAPSPPLSEGDTSIRKTYQMPKQGTGTSQGDSTTTMGIKSPPEKKKNDEG